MNTNYILVAVLALVVIGGAVIYMQQNTTSDKIAETQKVMLEKEAALKAEMAAKEKALMDNKTKEGDTGEVGVMVGGALMLPTLNIIDNAVKASNVTTLVAAVKAAGLVDTLKGPGPFTVFAPTNDAFAKLPAGTVDALLKADKKADLTSILTYHVVAGRYIAADLKDGMTLKTVNGATLTVSNVNGVVKINGAAMVQTADVISSNGVTHVIDTVLMPPKA